MARGRMLNKKISHDESVAKLSLKATLLYTWMIAYADVEGRMYGNEAYLKGNIIPFVNEIKTEEINNLLLEMSENKLICYYGDVVKFIQLCGWENNQTVNKDREAKSDIPKPTPEQLQSNSRPTPCKVNISKVNISKVNQHFEKCWSEYPRRLGKKEALRHYTASVTTEADQRNLEKAIANYKAQILQNKTEEQFVKHGSTFFNNWQDYVDKRGFSKAKTWTEMTMEEQEEAMRKRKAGLI